MSKKYDIIGDHYMHIMLQLVFTVKAVVPAEHNQIYRKGWVKCVHIDDDRVQWSGSMVDFNNEFELIAKGGNS